MSAKGIQIANSNIALWCENSNAVGIVACLSRDQACDLVMALQYWIDHSEFPPDPTEEAA